MTGKQMVFIGFVGFIFIGLRIDLGSATVGSAGVGGIIVPNMP